MKLTDTTVKSTKLGKIAYTGCIIGNIFINATYTCQIFFD